MDFKKYFDVLKKYAIKIEYSSSQQDLPIGRSKFGGNPDLPKGFIWPYFESESFEGVTKNRPLAFLAQINLSEVSEYDKEKLLPSKGFLYFFYDLTSQPWGYDINDKGCAKVYYHDASTDKLMRTDFPEDIDELSIVSEFDMSFESKLDLPDASEFMEYHVQCDWDEYDKKRTEYGYLEIVQEECSKLLGYADIIQNPMQLECELVTNGLYLGDGDDFENLSESEKNHYVKNSEEWILLFQMGILKKSGYELMFGDCGCIYYYIKKSDLSKRNFDNSWLIQQCY